MNQDKHGFLLINKPVGPTSHDMVDKLRKITKIKKIGHAGTLDPFADGLLIMAVGRQATKCINEFVKLDKRYVATLKLGAETDTYDSEGKITKEYDKKDLEKEELMSVLKKFVGKQKQVPPMFSAKKKKGKKLYELARAREIVEREAISIEVFSIDLLEYDNEHIKIEVHSSSGTYMRSLAFDIGRALGVGAYLINLTRTAIGPYSLDKAINIKSLNHENWTQKLFKN